MNRNVSIFRSDNKNTRHSKKALKRKIKSSSKSKPFVKRIKVKSISKNKRSLNYLYSPITYNLEIQNFCDKNNIHKWRFHPNSIDLDLSFSLFNNPSKVLTSLLNILYLAKTKSQFVTLLYKGHVSFGALYFVDTICHQIGTKRKWELKHNLPKKERTILNNLKSIFTNSTESADVYTINKRIKINRDNDLAIQQYSKQSKEIRDFIIQALRVSIPV